MEPDGTARSRKGGVLPRLQPWRRDAQHYGEKGPDPSDRSVLSGRSENADAGGGGAAGGRGRQALEGRADPGILLATQ